MGQEQTKTSKEKSVPSTSGAVALRASSRLREKKLSKTLQEKDEKPEKRKRNAQETGIPFASSVVQVACGASNRPFRCVGCGREFAQNQVLRQHSCASNRPFGCGACGRRFAQNEVLQQHFVGIHCNVSANQCNLCVKKFGSRMELDRHIKVFHCPNSQSRTAAVRRT